MPSVPGSPREQPRSQTPHRRFVHHSSVDFDPVVNFAFKVLVGKKNLEVRPIAVNKGEIVKRILYFNPDAEFVFCAGDDKVCALSC